MQANIGLGRKIALESKNAADISTPDDISFAGLALASLWRDSCLANHRLCNIGSPLTADPPTRLLNVTDPKRAYLEETTGLGWKPYVALSYCWGPGEHFQTLRENVNQHRSGIPVDDLPATLRGAIQATNQLGYGHIWIDALCIIQDDKADLGKELEHMGDIYRHAVLTLCAAGAETSHSGLFHRKNPLELYPCKVHVTAVPGGREVELDVALTGICNGHDYLAARGWVLQEEVLSSRAVIFGSEISWRCIESWADETSPVPHQTRRSEPGTDEMRLWLYEPDHATQANMAAGKTPFDAWQNMVRGYSDRDLSFTSDTLRAISGLADMFARMHGTTYLAGLWKENLMADLAWYVFVNDARVVETHETRLAAPSWSWASVGKVRIRFPRQSSAYGLHTGIRRPAPAILLHVFCTSKDPINDAAAVRPSEAGVEYMWSLKLAGPLRRLVLLVNKDYADWRINKNIYGEEEGETPYKSSSAMVSSAIQPRFPGILSRLDSPGRIVGEVALDSHALPVNTDRRITADGECMNVFCLPLLDEDRRRSHEPGLILCLVLAPLQPGSNLYMRLGLGYLTEEGWFGKEPNDDMIVECDIV